MISRLLFPPLPSFASVSREGKRKRRYGSFLLTHSLFSPLFLRFFFPPLLRERGGRKGAMAHSGLSPFCTSFLSRAGKSRSGVERGPPFFFFLPRLLFSLLCGQRPPGNHILPNKRPDGPFLFPFFLGIFFFLPSFYACAEWPGGGGAKGCSPPATASFFSDAPFFFFFFPPRVRDYIARIDNP